MEGNLQSVQEYGVIPRSAVSIFDALEAKQYSDVHVTVSLLEIYNEELCDLLEGGEKQKLAIMEGKQGPFCRYVVGGGL